MERHVMFGGAAGGGLSHARAMLHQLNMLRPPTNVIITGIRDDEESWAEGVLRLFSHPWCDDWAWALALGVA